MNSRKCTARRAGLLYLILAITGFFGLLYVPGQLIVPDNMAATMQHVNNSEGLLRLGIMANLIGQTAYLFLAIVLYRLFKEVNRKVALSLLIMVTAAVPIAFINQFNYAGLLILNNNPAFIQSFSAEQVQALANIFVDLSNYGIYIVDVFWGLWLFPFGYLAYKSGFIPKIFGIMLMIGCFGYLAELTTFLMFPGKGEWVFTIATIPSAIAELSVMLWLIIMGVKKDFATAEVEN